MRKTLSVISATWLCLFFTSSWAGDPMAMRTSESYREYFEIDLPIGITVVSESPVEDFVLYKFSEHGKIILTVYLGNAPDQKGFKSKASQFRAGTVQISSNWTNEVLARREWLIQRRSSGWPQYLHIFTGEDAGKGDRLASSIRVKSLSETR